MNSNSKIKVVFLIGLVLLSVSITHAEESEPRLGRLPDGRAYRIDQDGNQLVDYIAELELERDTLNNQVNALKNDVDAKEKFIEEKTVTTNSNKIKTKNIKLDHDSDNAHKSITHASDSNVMMVVPDEELANENKNINFVTKEELEVLKTKTEEQNAKIAKLQNDLLVKNQELSEAIKKQSQEKEVLEAKAVESNQKQLTAYQEEVINKEKKLNELNNKLEEKHQTEAQLALEVEKLKHELNKRESELALKENDIKTKAELIKEKEETLAKKDQEIQKVGSVVQDREQKLKEFQQVLNEQKVERQQKVEKVNASEKIRIEKVSMDEDKPAILNAKPEVPSFGDDNNDSENNDVRAGLQQNEDTSLSELNDKSVDAKLKQNGKAKYSYTKQEVPVEESTEDAASLNISDERKESLSESDSETIKKKVKTEYSKLISLVSTRDQIARKYNAKNQSSRGAVLIIKPRELVTNDGEDLDSIQNRLETAYTMRDFSLLSDDINKLKQMAEEDMSLFR